MPLSADEALPDRLEASHSTKGLLRLTMACNERCVFCNVPAEDYPRPTPSLDEIEVELQVFVASGQQTLTISGGEPTLLRKRLLGLIRRARALGVPLVELQTNAVLIDEDYAVDLAQAGLTSAFVSLLSHDAAWHDQLADLEGAWKRCLVGLDALLAQGIRVTLNPVFARLTQDSVADYVHFVARRLPGVDSLSLSVVQPHGRAAAQAGLALMPDYDLLATSVRAGRVAAALHGLRVLNPYCGLPLCVGWEDDLAHSVEAAEAIEASIQPGGVASQAPGGLGLNNDGNKRHGPPCTVCALRTRCGGAWHAVWDQRSGRGLSAPIEARPPWAPGSADAQGQIYLSEEQATTTSRSARVAVPTVWVQLESLSPRRLTAILAGPATDLALVLRAEQLDPTGQPDRLLVSSLRRLEGHNAPLATGRRLRAWLRVEDHDVDRVQRVLQLATSLGVHSVDLHGAVTGNRAALAALFPVVSQASRRLTWDGR